MPRGDDTRHHSNRKVTKEALGSRYAEIGVGFGDDPRVQKVAKPRITAKPKGSSDYTPPKGRSDLPRLSGVLAGHLNSALDEYEEGVHYDEYGTTEPEHQAEQDFRDSYSIASPLRQNGFDLERVSEYEAQDMLNHYRKQRDKGQDQPFSRGDIKDAYRNRSEY